MISILLLFATVIVFLSGSWLPRLNGFLSDLEEYDLVHAPIEFCQRLILVILEFIPKRSVRSYPRDCCHHHLVLLRVVYCCQLVVEMLDICL